MARKVKTNKKSSAAGAKSAAGGQGKRLTPDQKAEIAAAGNTGLTLSELAEQFSVSIPTVRRIVGPRRGGKAGGTAAPGGRSRGSSGKFPGGVSVNVIGDEIVIRLPRKHLLRNLVGDLLD